MRNETLWYESWSWRSFWLGWFILLFRYWLFWFFYGHFLILFFISNLFIFFSLNSTLFQQFFLLFLLSNFLIFHVLHNIWNIFRILFMKFFYFLSFFGKLLLFLFDILLNFSYLSFLYRHIVLNRNGISSLIILRSR